MVNIFNCDCIEGAQAHLDEGSIDLLICDPPFGLNEAGFGKHYARKTENVLEGYVEAPEAYGDFTHAWMGKALAVLRPGGYLVTVMGHTQLKHVLNAVDEHGFDVVNHAIWKYNFGVATRNKFVTSHYHVVIAAKPGGERTFNSNCRFGPSERDEKGKSLQYADMEDVFFVKKEYVPNQMKNMNKLPTALIEKLVLYLSNESDVVGDFFLGNFTTAYVAHALGRNVVGFEINKEAYDLHYPQIKQAKFGDRLLTLKKVHVKVPLNQGKSVSDADRQSILSKFNMLKANGSTKKDAISSLCEEFGRGRFSIINILKREGL